MRAVRGVQGADRFVADQQPGVGDDPAGDRDPLALAAGDLAGQTVEELRAEADGDEGLGGALTASRGIELPTDREPFRDDVGDPLGGVERAQRVLEDELDPAAAA